jgi:hypothetical protein
LLLNWAVKIEVRLYLRTLLLLKLSLELLGVLREWIATTTPREVASATIAHLASGCSFFCVSSNCRAGTGAVTTMASVKRITTLGNTWHPEERLLLVRIAFSHMVGWGR